ncbi:hypothetical protein D3C87_1745930 [compost metagenome]
MFEQAVIQPLHKRQDACALSSNDIDSHDVQRIDVVKGKIDRPDLPPPLPLSAQSFEQDKFRLAETGLRQQFRNESGRALIRSNRDDPRSGMQMRSQKIDGTPV